MRRVLVRIWGVDGTTYVGRRMTLYWDEAVQFGGVAVGGIRISHMSGISSAVTTPLTEKRASRKPFTVKPLPEERDTAPRETKGTPEQKQIEASAPTSAGMTKRELYAAARVAAAKGQDAFDEWVNPLPEAAYDALGQIWAELQELIAKADEGFPGDTPATGQAA
ncbi:hypothetical protein [Methylobacterium oryzae]|uniref:hypothetical protein n=1 Tax=Methylobacterium oryzae TaxID=334852 RepID=UPI002F35783F